MGFARPAGQRITTQRRRPGTNHGEGNEHGSIFFGFGTSEACRFLRVNWAMQRADKTGVSRTPGHTNSVLIGRKRSWKNIPCGERPGLAGAPQHRWDYASSYAGTDGGRSVCQACTGEPRSEGYCPVNRGSPATSNRILARRPHHRRIRTAEISVDRRAAGPGHRTVLPSGRAAPWRGADTLDGRAPGGPRQKHHVSGVASGRRPAGWTGTPASLVGRNGTPRHADGGPLTGFPDGGPLTGGRAWRKRCFIKLRSALHLGGSS